MSARKAVSAGSFDRVTLQARQTQLALAHDAVLIRKNGIEFRSPSPFAPWTEMTITLQSPADDTRVNCAGVVVSCLGNRHTGYEISVVFTSLSRLAEARLSSLASASLV